MNQQKRTGSPFDDMDTTTVDGQHGETTKRKRRSGAKASGSRQPQGDERPGPAAPAADQPPRPPQREPDTPLTEEELAKLIAATEKEVLEEIRKKQQKKLEAEASATDAEMVKRVSWRSLRSSMMQADTRFSRISLLSMSWPRTTPTSPECSPRAESPSWPTASTLWIPKCERLSSRTPRRSTSQVSCLSRNLCAREA